MAAAVLNTVDPLTLSPINYGSRSSHRHTQYADTATALACHCVRSAATLLTGSTDAGAAMPACGNGVEGLKGSDKHQRYQCFDTESTVI
jgi:hypothetical protein